MTLAAASQRLRGDAGTGEHLSLAERASRSEAYLSAIVQSSDDAIIGKTLDVVVVSNTYGRQRQQLQPARILP